MIELVKAGTSDALVINAISKRSFDSDVEIGAPSKGGPSGYMSIQFHTKMARLNHLYTRVTFQKWIAPSGNKTVPKRLA